MHITAKYSVLEAQNYIKDNSGYDSVVIDTQDITWTAAEILSFMRIAKQCQHNCPTNWFIPAIKAVREASRRPSGAVMGLGEVKGFVEELLGNPDWKS